MKKASHEVLSERLEATSALAKTLDISQVGASHIIDNNLVERYGREALKAVEVNFGASGYRIALVLKEGHSWS